MLPVTDINKIHLSKALAAYKEQLLRMSLRARDDKGNLFDKPRLGFSWVPKTQRIAKEVLNIAYLGIRGGNHENVFRELILPHLLQYANGGVFAKKLLPEDKPLPKSDLLKLIDALNPTDDRNPNKLSAVTRGILLHQLGVETKRDTPAKALEYLKKAIEILKGKDTQFEVSAHRQCAEILKTTDSTEALRYAKKSWEILNSPPVRGIKVEYHSDYQLDFYRESALPSLARYFASKLDTVPQEFSEFVDNAKKVYSKNSILEALKLFPGFTFAQLIAEDKNNQRLINTHDLFRDLGGDLDTIKRNLNQNISEVTKHPGRSIDIIHGHLIAALILWRLEDQGNYATLQKLRLDHLQSAEALIHENQIVDDSISSVVTALKENR